MAADPRRAVDAGTRDYRDAGEHFHPPQLPLVRAAGFEIVEAQRLKAGSVERISARKPTTD